MGLLDKLFGKKGDGDKNADAIVIPGNEWLDKFESVKALFVPQGNLAGYFTEAEIAGKKMSVLDIGTVTFPTGYVLVEDPLAYLPNRNMKPFFTQVPIGEFPIQIAVVTVGEEHDRYAAVRVLFSDEFPMSFVEALSG